MYAPGEEYTGQSAADLSTKQFYIVKTDSNGNIVLASSATDELLGVLHDGGRLSGDSVSVVTVNGSGTFKVKAGGTIAKDAYLTPDSNGAAIATTTAGNRIIGRAMRSAVAGDIVEYIKIAGKY